MLHFFAKRLGAARKEEKGFTLIELLVVIIIIGILAAIAVPTFLNQRQRAQNAAAQSDLRNAATFQEVYFTEQGKYTGTLGDLTNLGFRQSQNVTTKAAINTSGSDYCMTAKHASSPTAFYATSASPTPSSTAPTPPAGVTCPTP